MTDSDFEQTSSHHPAAILRRLSGPIKVVRNGAARLVERVPETLRATQVGAQATTKALQKLPDSTLRSLATSSVWLGAGLYLAGKRRLALAVGAAPAAIVGAAILLRPGRSIAPTEGKS